MPSAEVGSAYATLGLDDSKLDSGLSGAKSKFSSAVDAMEGKAKSVGSAIGSALTTGAVAAGAALVGVATVGVKTYMDIESAAADAASKMDLSAIAQASGKSMEEAFTGVKEHVMGLADELGQLNTNAFDPTQIAQACANLAAQGFDVATASAEDLAPVLALATATNYDLGDSADMALAAMNTFGKGVEDLGHIADVYTTACGASAAGMGDLNYAMQQAGPVASVANVGFETLTACLETFSQSNIKGEKAGTALRGAINTLITPTQSLSDGLDAIGLSMADVDPRSNDFVDILAKMESQADASGQGLSAFTKIFGAEGGLLYSLASNTDQIEKFRQGLLNCGGAAETMAKFMLDKLGGSLDAAMGAASSLAYLIGGKLAPTLKSAFEWFSAEGAPAIRSFIEALSAGDFSAAGAQIGITVEKIKSAVAGLATGAGIAVFAAGLASLIPVAASMAAGVVASAAAMVAGTAASIAAMVAAHVSGFASMVAASVSSWASMKAQAIASWLSMKLAAVASMALTVEITLAGYATMAATAAANMGMMATSTIGKFAAMALGAVASALSMAASVAAAFGSMAMNAALRLSTMTTATLAGYAKMAAGALASVAAMVAGTLAGFASMVTGVVASVAGMAAALAAPLLLIGAGLAAIGLAADPSKFTTLGKIGSNALKGLKSVVSDCWEAAKKGDFSAVVTRLKAAFSSSVDYIKNINWSGVGSDIAKAIGTGWEALKGYAAAAGTAAMEALKSAFAFGSDIAKGLYEDFKNVDWGGVWDSLVSAWDAAIAKLSDVGSTILGYFDSIDWGTVGFKIGQAIRDAITALADIGQKVWDYLTSADWSGAGSSISEKIKAGLAKLKEFWTEFKSGISSVDFATAGKEIGDKIKAGLGKVADYAKSIYEKIKTGWDSWIAEDGPKKLGESFAHSVVKGVVDLGKWIYDKIADYWKSNGSSIGSNFSALFHSAIDFGKTALKAAYDFVTGFANTVLTAGKGTIGAAILEIIGGAMNSAWEGAGDSIIEQATQWRKDAEGIWEASDFDTTIAATVDWLGGSSLPEDGETRSVTVVTTVAGEDITEKIKSISGSVGPGGGQMKGYWMNGEYKLKPWEDPKIKTVVPDVSAKDWAYQMGLTGANFESTKKLLSESAPDGYIRPEDLAPIMAEFAKGQAEYDAAHKTAAEEAAEIEIAAAEEEAEIETEAAEEAAATTTEAAKDAASTEKSAAQELYRTLIGGSKEAANAIKIGSEIGAGSVRIGLDSAGREIAIIGQVAQQRFAEAGGILYDRVQVAGSSFSGAVSAAISGLQSKIQYAGSAIQTSAGGAGAALAAKINAAASDFQLKGTYAGSAIQNGAGNAASKLSLGASDILTKSYNAGSAIRSGGSDAGSALSTGAGSLRSAASAVSSAASKLFTENPFGHLYASGTVTSGPELAVIGEDGPANPEFVIPTKTKRWDLLYAALRAYGVRGFAEGTATGGTAAAVDPDAMAAYFSITGLASMSKQVQRVINSLKDFFRISWGIIKSEGATYWKQINTVLTAEVTTFRDSAWEAIIDVRNTSITSFQEILTGVKSAFSEMWPSISGYVDEVKTGLTSAMTDAGTSTVDAINQMILNAEGALTAWATKWAETWDQMLTDLSEAQTQIQEACTEIATELAKINVSVNINASINSGYGGGGGGGGYMDWNFGGDDDWLAPTGDWSTNGYRQTTTGPCPLGGGCPDYNRAVRDSIMPLDDRYIGGGGGGGGYQLPWIFAARGALIDDGPQKVIAGEAGPELILPAKLTRMFLSLADAGLGSAGSRPIVIEDHTEHRWYLDGKEVTNALMDRVVKQLKLNGAVPVR